MSEGKQKRTRNRKRTMMDEINIGLSELAGQLAEYVTLLRDSGDGQAPEH